MTGVRTIYLPDNAGVLTEAGYVVLTFDYKGWGDSDGPKSLLAPYSRVTDVQAALTFLGVQPEVLRAPRILSIATRFCCQTANLRSSARQRGATIQRR